MPDTTTLINRVKNRVGSDSDLGSALGERAMILAWLDEAQKILAGEGPILVTIFKGSSVANAEALSVPVPDFYAIHRVELRRPTTNVYRELTPMRPLERPVDRTVRTGDVPSKYLVWGGNDVDGNNVQALLFDKNFAESDVDNGDLWIWIRQMPKTMAENTQAPEVTERWQMGLLCYAEMRWRMRQSAVDPTQITLVKMLAPEWEEWKAKARRHRVNLDRPLGPVNNAGYFPQDDAD